ncbi:MAG: complex I NDUFA9 subunit family protein [Aquabacterium sp.]
MQRILILGGSGFVGRAVCEQLAAHPVLQGARLVVPTRRRDRARHLSVLPQVDVVEADVNDQDTLLAVSSGCDAVVNLIAILHGTPGAFEAAHVALCRRLVQACRHGGVPRIVHVSALGVPEGDPATAPSLYLRSKAEGERLLRSAEGLAVTVLRPSVIFGEHDRFLNLFATLQRLMPVMPLAGSDARFQPVWVEDVARAIVACLSHPSTAGKTYELAGPRVYTLQELVALAGQWSGHARVVVPMPMAVGRMQAALMACLPGEPPMSADNLDSMKVPNVASGAHPGLAALGIIATALEAVAPAYLRRQVRGVQQWLDAWRQGARR